MRSVYLARARPLSLLCWVVCLVVRPVFAQPTPIPAGTPPTPAVDKTQPAEPQLGAEFLAPPKMTLTAALDYALKNQPAVKAALARVSAREADVGIPRGQWLPAVGLTAQVIVGSTNNTTASYFAVAPVQTPRIGGTGVTDGSGASWSPEPSTFAGLGLTQEVFDFGRITAEVAAADSLVGVERRTADAQSLDIRLGVEEAYFAVYSARAVLVAAEDGYERTRVHFELAKVGVSAGLRSPIEQTRAAAELARLDIGRIRARGSLRVAQTLLAAAVGSPEPALDIADQPPGPAEMPSLDVAVKRALQKEPLLQAALRRIQAQEDETRAAFAQLRPDLFLAGTLDARAGGATPSNGASVPQGNGWIPNVPNWQVGIILSWPLFEGTLWARGKSSEQLEVVRREEAALIQQQLLARVDGAYVSVLVAREALPRLKASVDAATANYAQADARFRAGLGTAVELADAEAIRTDAEISLALGEFELARSRASFGRAIAEGM
jgi:outer membrane protein